MASLEERFAAVSTKMRRSGSKGLEFLVTEGLGDSIIDYFGELQQTGLLELEQIHAFTSIVHDPFSEGFDKNIFQHLKKAGGQGAGIDAIVLLSERMDLLIQVEGTLSHLFDREISLDWDSGRLVPKARRRGNNALYRLDREECHGIKEMLVLLTHLYDDRNQFLIIDEPELNLHPQYQAFFLEEVRKIDPRRMALLTLHSLLICNRWTS